MSVGASTSNGQRLIITIAVFTSESRRTIAGVSSSSRGSATETTCGWKTHRDCYPSALSFNEGHVVPTDRSSKDMVPSRSRAERARIGRNLPVAKEPGQVYVRVGLGRMCEAVLVNEADWELRVSNAWTSIEQRSETEFLTLIDDLAAELPSDSGIGIFERAASLDSTGHSDLAVPLYRESLGCGLTGERRRRAVIQLASSLRNLGRPEESVALLTAELDSGSDHLDDAVRAFLALALVDIGREREAVSLALAALAPHLARYQRSLANYARLLVDAEPGAT